MVARGARGRSGCGRRHAPAGPFATLLLCAAVALGGCAPDADDLDAALREVTAGARFSFAQWETSHLVRLGRKAQPVAGAVPSELVQGYLDLTSVTEERRAQLRRLEADSGGRREEVETLRAEVRELDLRLEALSDPVEALLSGQIRATLTDAGIYGPADRWLPAGPRFPPVWFEITQPPLVLVVSPRDEIVTVRETMLVPDLTVAEMQEMETRIDALGYSSLVVRIGGFGGLYPSMVAESASLPFLVDAATEEWLHQYLAFTPLGFRYVLDLLGISRSYEVATLNETTAPMVSAEIRDALLARYYPEYLPAGGDEPEAPADPNAFDFHREMRAIRLRVDALLAEGYVDEAEAYMAERRDYLEANGYYIRRLNQAYFAFHGTYAADPGSVDPIGEEVRLLRAESGTLSAFLNRMVGITSRAELRRALGLGE